MKEFVNTEKELQDKIDVEKWLKSEKAGRDLCGEEDFCFYCDKKEEYPCGHACLVCENNKNRKEAAATVKSDDDKAETEKKVVEVEGYEKVIRLTRSFASRLIQDENLQKNYSAVKNTFEKYKKVKGRVSFSAETYRAGREKLAVVAVRGKSLYIYLALNPVELEDSKYRFTDESDRASYVSTPVKVKITGSRSLKHACELIDILAEKKELVLNEKYESTEYVTEYLTDKELIEKGLIKERTVLVKKK